MTLKLALRNVHRSARDYAIYFVTIVLGVALFYAFNSISSQAVLFDALSTESTRMLDLMDMFMGVFSGVVACVLGFLVVYANRFLIRRRKREFGMYLMLGMGSGRVSRILVCETLMVGVLSLAVGLMAGITLSQGLSFVTAALMGTTMSKYQFIVAPKAIAFTAVCFAIIFVVSAVIDVVYIGRCKLSSLLSARASSEKIRMVKPGLSAAGFFASIAILAAAYWQLNVNKLQMLDEHFIAATVLMVVGTFLFFWSVSGFAIAMLQRSNLYFKGLIMFTTRQISSKMTTAFASMAAVSIMLFFALTTTCVGMGMVDLFVGSVNETTQYDATTSSLPDSMRKTDPGYKEFQRYDGDIAAYMSSRSKTWNDVVKDTAQLDYYRTDVKYSALIDQASTVSKAEDEGTLSSIAESDIRVLSLSDFNQLRQLNGKGTISLASDEFAVNNQIEGTQKLAEAFVKDSVKITVAGISLHCGNQLLQQPMRTSAIKDASLEIIVPDAVVDTLKAAGQLPDSSNLNVAYKLPRVEGDPLFKAALGEALGLETSDDRDYSADFLGSYWPVLYAYTGQEMAEQASGLRMLITYLALYIGFVLVMATAAILAIQQLSETNDSLPRYRYLAATGCPSRKVMGSLRIQTVVYFLAPLLLAACHTACAVSVINGSLYAEIGVNILSSVIVCVVATMLLYGIYLLVAYASSRQMVKRSLV